MFEGTIRAEVSRQLASNEKEVDKLSSKILKMKMDINEFQEQNRVSFLGNDDGYICRMYGKTESEFKRMMNTRIRRIVQVELKKTIDYAIREKIEDVGLYREDFIDDVVRRIRMKQVGGN